MDRLNFWLDALERAGYTVFVGAFVVALVFGPGPSEAAPAAPMPGATCTYTAPLASVARAPARTYEVEVVSTFEASYERDGRPWLWVKRPSEARYQSVIVSPDSLTGCR